MLAILIATIIALIFSDAILKLLLILSGGLQLKAFSFMDGFMIKLRNEDRMSLHKTESGMGFLIGKHHHETNGNNAQTDFHATCLPDSEKRNHRRGLRSNTKGICHA
jgi:hypothetical protein